MLLFLTNNRIYRTQQAKVHFPNGYARWFLLARLLVRLFSWTRCCFAAASASAPATSQRRSIRCMMIHLMLLRRLPGNGYVVTWHAINLLTDDVSNQRPIRAHTRSALRHQAVVTSSKADHHPLATARQQMGPYEVFIWKVSLNVFSHNGSYNF